VTRAPLKWVHAWLCNAMYFDELYDWTAARLVHGLALAAMHSTGTLSPTSSRASHEWRIG